MSSTQGRGSDPHRRDPGASSEHSQAPARGTRQNGRKWTCREETRTADGGHTAGYSGGRREEYITPGVGGLKLWRAEHEIHSRFIWGWREAPALINLQPNSQQSNHSGARHSECRAGQSRYVKSALADLATRSPRRPISLCENCVSSSIYVKSA